MTRIVYGAVSQHSDDDTASDSGGPLLSSSPASVGGESTTARTFLSSETPLTPPSSDTSSNEFRLLPPLLCGDEEPLAEGTNGAENSNCKRTALLADEEGAARVGADQTSQSEARTRTAPAPQRGHGGPRRSNHRQKRRTAS